MRKFQIVAGCLILAALEAFAQTPEPRAAAASETPTIHAGAEEVMLDVIARDKKGQSVTDLTPDDLEIYDNGVRRKIKSFRLVEGNQAIVSNEPAANGHPLQQVRLVTLIFNRLDLNARQLSRTAGLDLLKNEFPSNVYMAVLVLGDSLQALQPVTNDRDLLRKAITRATSGAYTEFISDSQRIQPQMKEILGPASGGES